MPIHNQESIIRDNLQAIIDFTGGSYEIILIMDSCNDNSSFIVIDFFKNLDLPQNLIRVIICESEEVPLFETICDNIGFRLASGKWFLEIQADMKMTEMDYNLTLCKPFLKYDNVIAVSGRCSHDLKEETYSGKYGNLIESSISNLGVSNNNFYVNEACNRGPLLLCAEKTRELGFLDEMNFFLEYSEIDLMLRAFDKKQWICGYVPIDFESPLYNGTTRKTRDALNKYIYIIRKNRTTGGFLATYHKKGQFRTGYILPL